MDDALGSGESIITEDGIEVISSPTTLAHLLRVAQRTFGDLGLVKAVVDVERPSAREQVEIGPGSGHSGSCRGRRARTGEAVNRAALHPGLTSDRWGQMNLADQLANIGTEVARAARSKARGDDLRLGQHFDLVLELFEFTLDDDRWRGQRMEIGRARELVCDYLAGENEYGSSAESLDAYFLPFAYLALQNAAGVIDP